METIATILSCFSLLGVIIIYLLRGQFLASYLAEKGKNFASKEDFENVTAKLENLKTENTKIIEHEKARLLSESQVNERKRHAYEEISSSLHVFISGRKTTEYEKDSLHKAYDAAWLWASDEVLIALNYFIKIQIKNTSHPNSVSQINMRTAYAHIIFAMRKDIGFTNTIIKPEDYQIVSFSE